jgi:hypothetical protein
MPIDGYFSRSAILEVLRFHGVSIEDDPENEGALLLRRGSTSKSKHLDEDVPRAIVWELSRAFGIKMYEFDDPHRVRLKVIPKK